MARELSKKGKEVILCDAGKNQQWLGKNSVLLLGMMDKMGMNEFFTRFLTDLSDPLLRRKTDD